VAKVAAAKVEAKAAVVGREVAKLAGAGMAQEAMAEGGAEVVGREEAEKAVAATEAVAREVAVMV
jgi:hypothetical protein